MILIRIPNLELKNPLNGATGNSKIAGIIKTRERAKIRKAVSERVKFELLAKMRPSAIPGLLPIRVQITRISPGKLDRWDGLPASMKACVDGIADVFELRDDDPRFEWLPPLQRKDGKGVYGCEIRIERVAGGISKYHGTADASGAERR